MKNNRQIKLLEIIESESIETQEQLLARLEKAGIHSTQATISRDIKQLHLIKEPTGLGGYRYAVSAKKTHLNLAERLRTIFRESVLSVDYAQNLVVLKTMEGLANGAGSAVDKTEGIDIVGTLAGDDTVLLVMRDTESAATFCRELREQLH